MQNNNVLSCSVYNTSSGHVVLFVTDVESYAQALQLVQQADMLAVDIETTGLNMRTDKIMGVGISTELDGFYIPLYTPELVELPGQLERLKAIYSVLQAKHIITFNGAFDLSFIKLQHGVDLLDRLHTDVLLLKHTCDENFPLDLKGIAVKLWGQDVKREKEEMQASIKSNGGTAKQFYKASTETLGKYCIRDCILTWRVYTHYRADLAKQGLTKFFYEDEVMPLYREVTIPMELHGVALDMPKLLETQANLAQALAQLEADIQHAIAPHLEIFTSWYLAKEYPEWTSTGKASAWRKKHATAADAFYADNPDAYMFNLLSKHHLKKLFFETLDCEPLSRTPTGMPQVDEEFLESVKDRYDWVPLLIQYNKLTKLKGTYVDRFIEESYEGRFYARYMQHRTVSGRYGGDLQQLPRPIPGDDVVAKFNNVVREFILPDSGCLLCSADYEQLEPTIFAHTSGDARLRAIFNSRADFYSTVAIQTEGLRGSADKEAEDYIGKTQKEARQKAKAYSLGIAYGMTGYKLAFELGIEQKAAELLVRQYLAAFPDLAKFIYKSHDFARAHGWVQQELGRKRHMPELKRIWQRYGSRIADALTLWKEFNGSPEKYAEAKEQRKIYKNLLNNAVNFQVQSLAASIVNRAAIAVTRRLKTEGLSTRIVSQIHDELVFTVPYNEIERATPIIKETMQTVVKLTVPLRTEPQYGKNFKECK